MRISFGIGLALVAFGCAAHAATPEYAPGRLLVQPRESANATTVARTLTAHRAMARGGAGRMKVLTVPEASEAAMASLRASGLFEYVERDYYAHTAAFPTDPSAFSQWYLPVVSLPQAFDVTQAGALVAVVDSGIDTSHPEFTGRLLAGWNFLKQNTDVTDVLGHGTAVAGTLAAAANNGAGGSGISPQSQILPLVVVDANDMATYSDIAAAIQYAADHGARIINVSIGGLNASAALQNAVDYAWSRGAVVFAAAMNGASSAPYYPAACNHVVAVSATDSSDGLASFSSYGDWVTLSAPGSNILAPMPGGGYGYWYGTSFASPIAAGVAALALAEDSSLTAQELVDLLVNNVDDLGAAGKDPSYGWGRVNAYKTVVAARPVVISVSVTPLAASLYAGQSVQFAGVAANSTKGLTWALSPAVGTISAAGLYTAPSLVASAQVVTVTATSVQDPTRSYSCVVRLMAPVMSLSPASVTLKAGGVQPFTASVTGSTEAVTWTISPAVGSISSAGIYTAPASVASSQTVTVTASVTGARAIAVVNLSPTAFTPIRVNAGGGAYTDPLGQVWAADYGVTGGSTWTTSHAIYNTNTQPLYQSQRYGVMTYQFTVPNGSYQVTLKFVEASQMGIGFRKFNVALNGVAALTAFDIYKQAGGPYLPLDKTFPVTVTGGKIQIDFTAGASNWPEVDAIEIVASSAAPSQPAAGGARKAQTPLGRQGRSILSRR